MPSTLNSGPVTAGVEQTQPFGTMARLSVDELRTQQRVTLGTARRRYGIGARVLFTSLDLVYGKGRNLEKFRVLELAARVPYQAWEQVAYVAMTHKADEPDFAGRIFTNVRAARREQDNEQWHLLILEELISRASHRRRYGRLRTLIAPQLLAFVWYHVAWMLYVVNPKASYRLNADFEDHAEHEYALLVQEHPEWERETWESDFAPAYGSNAQTLADLFRSIGHDERIHRLESEAQMARPRFR